MTCIRNGFQREISDMKCCNALEGTSLCDESFWSIGSQIVEVHRGLRNENGCIHKGNVSFGSKGVGEKVGSIFTFKRK